MRKCDTGKARKGLAYRATRVCQPERGGGLAAGPAVRSEGGAASCQFTMTSLPITPREPMWA